MHYYSLNKKSPNVNFKDALITSQAPDKGLYFPSEINSLDTNFWYNIEKFSNIEIGFKLLKHYVGDAIPDDVLKKIITETINFDIPLKNISNHISVLELFHGPTLAFKDVGARFMSRCLGYFKQQENFKDVMVLVATSGDTGGAVAAGFYDVPGIQVVILYPSKKVSLIQEKQLTTLGKNIIAIEIDGTFDDCQAIVKTAFADEDLRQKKFITSANSINIARWLPQQIYYAFAWKQWQDKDNPPVVCVPSGNFGNIVAAMMAYKAGMPTKHFIAACNANDVIPHYYQTQQMTQKKSVATLSNAMDVALPNNFVRLQEIFKNDFTTIKNISSAYSVSDTQTIQTMQDVWQKHQYMLDPHGAVGYYAFNEYLKQHPNDAGYIVETAHPCKFDDAIQQALNISPELPKEIIGLLQKNKKSIFSQPDYHTIKQILLQL